MVYNPPEEIPNLVEGLDEGQSRYQTYIMWLGYCGWKAGWTFEKEPLRVPSTRSWAIIGKSHPETATDIQLEIGDRRTTKINSAAGNGHLNK